MAALVNGRLSIAGANANIAGAVLILILCLSLSLRINSLPSDKSLKRHWFQVGYWRVLTYIHATSISVAFLSRDAMHNADYAVKRCHTPVLCRNGITILFFFTPNGTVIFPREPPNGGVECRRVKKSRYISEMIECTAIVTTECE